jgi:tRNA(fMet)-specific endonuclease VapC
MTKVVVDTDLVSFVFKNHTFGSRYDPELTGPVPLVSSMTIAEIERWVLQYRWGRQRVQLLRTFLRRFTVVPSSPDLCRRWAKVMAQSIGRRIESADAWIAATALLHDAPLLTNNWNDYVGMVGLNLISRAP